MATRTQVAFTEHKMPRCHTTRLGSVSATRTVSLVRGSIGSQGPTLPGNAEMLFRAHVSPSRPVAAPSAA